MTQQDNLIFNQIQKAGKGCVLAVNKWDKFHDVRMEHYIQSLVQNWPFLEYIPISITSGLENRNLEKTLNLLLQVYEESKKEISTPKINKFLTAALKKSTPAAKEGKRLNVFYGTQTGINPPAVTLFVNDKRLIRNNFMKYLENRFKEFFGFKGVPVKWVIRNRREANI